jgi:hypothetical protein
MIKVAFSCPWGINSHALKVGFARATPNNDGRWKDLVLVDDVYDADWIVGIEDLDSSLDISRIDQNKIILTAREPKWISRVNWGNYKTVYKFAHFLGNSHLPAGWSSLFTYTEMKEYKYHPREKKICVIMSNKRMCLGHKKRLNFVKEFCARYPGVLDVYGRGMETEGLGKNYKGVSIFGDNQKHEWLSQYDYALAFENGQGNGYFTEKLTDVFMAYTVPIYWGAPDIKRYFPGGFYNLDISKSESFEELYKIVSSPVTSDMIKNMAEARRKIMDEYAWMPTLKKIIDTGKAY